jgi:hypothetical protein
VILLTHQAARAESERKNRWETPFKLGGHRLGENKDGKKGVSGIEKTIHAGYSKGALFSISDINLVCPGLKACVSGYINTFISMLTQVTPVTKPPAAKKKATTRAVSDGGHAVRIEELTTVVHS